jgi:hypothetical protein
MTRARDSAAATRRWPLLRYVLVVAAVMSVVLAVAGRVAPRRAARTAPAPVRASFGVVHVPALGPSVVVTLDGRSIERVAARPAAGARGCWRFASEGGVDAVRCRLAAGEVHRFEAQPAGDRWQIVVPADDHEAVLVH